MVGPSLVWPRDTSSSSSSSSSSLSDTLSDVLHILQEVQSRFKEVDNYYTAFDLDHMPESLSRSYTLMVRGLVGLEKERAKLEAICRRGATKTTRLDVVLWLREVDAGLQELVSLLTDAQAHD